MDPSPPPLNDSWDVNRLRLPEGIVGNPTPSKRPPRHRPGEAFIKGPVPYSWMAAACRLPGSGLHVASTYWYLCHRYQGPNRYGLDALARSLEISDDTVRRALHSAEEAGLLSVVREPGCKLAVSIIPIEKTSFEVIRRPLYGPIPWAWWYAAMMQHGPALKTAAACWTLAGWEQMGEFEVSLAGWTDLGLSRFSVSRGLETLVRAGLIEMAAQRGRSPFVRLL